jgi:hypothetical protein
VYFQEGEVPGFDPPEEEKGYCIAMLLINKNFLITTEEIIDEFTKKERCSPFLL